MEWISLSELKVFDILINLGTVQKIIEHIDFYTVTITTKYDGTDIRLKFGKDSMILIHK